MGVVETEIHSCSPKNGSVQNLTETINEITGPSSHKALNPIQSDGRYRKS